MKGNHEQLASTHRRALRKKGWWSCSSSILNHCYAHLESAGLATPRGDLASLVRMSKAHSPGQR